MHLLDKVLSLLAPYDCVGCGDEGAAICNPCLYSIPRVPSRCYRCMAASSDFSTCNQCQSRTKLRHVWVATSYEGLTKQLLHVFKYERLVSAYTQISTMMDDSLPYLSDYVVVAVPTATTRRRQRGYDHALLLAQAICHKRGLIYERPVVRLSQTRQVGASRKTRFAQLKDSLLVTSPRSIKGKKILLVDDVITTGATLEAVGSQLRQHGAKEVCAVVFAQKL